jgi:TonB family protein
MPGPAAEPAAPISATASDVGNAQSGVLLAFVMRPYKHPCKNPSEWRFPPGKQPERLPQHYQFACDFGTPLMLALNDVHRSEPIYLCGTHAAETGRSRVVSTSGIKSSEPAPVGISSKGPAANANSVLNAQQRRRYRYVLLLVAGLALAGVLFGPRLFRTIHLRSRKPAVVAEAQKGMGSSTLPQKAPRKDQVAVPQEPSQAVPAGNTQLDKRALPTANVAAEGTIARQILPDVPKTASDTIRGTILVSVKVQVDASGNVERTELVLPGPSRYFARLAVESAQRWKFNPPVAAGQGSQSEWEIHFYFTREATKADATESVSAGTPRK